MANHGKTGTMLEKYRAQKRLRKAKHPSKGLTTRKDTRTKLFGERFAGLCEDAENMVKAAKEAAELAAMDTAIQAEQAQ